MLGYLSTNEYSPAETMIKAKEIEVLDEDTYPIELMAADPIAQAILADLKLSEEGAKDLSAAVASIKVSAKKPS